MRYSMTNESKKPQYEYDTLRIVLEESRNLRYNQLEHLYQVSGYIWNNLSFLMILLGIYTSSFIFLCDNSTNQTATKSIITSPLICSFILISIAIVYCLKHIYPTDMYKNPIPNAIYRMIINKKKDVSKKLIEMNLSEYRSSIIKTEERNAIRKQIILIAVASIFEFMLFVFINVFEDQYFLKINIISIIFFICFLIYIRYNIEKESARITKKHYALK